MVYEFFSETTATTQVEAAKEATAAIQVPLGATEVEKTAAAI